ncbi:MAG: amino acid ABC transporter substrate-binding protein [Actinomycetaceae bacterium]|nr:amino acid ABC transporter substrate-binding protein [Arcanobacterium sp.]MDD7687107.1 amino acid ABC transporter substrate-binding protein [Actinomycetaceae bacterium]MDY5273228.1 amino acid ABC transporter substrate-binding protein [Arcanobacterium sp.]
MRIKKIAALIAGVALTFSIAACSGSKAPANAEKAQGADFTVGFDAEFPPYGFQESGKYVGFDLELAQEVAQRNGWNFKPQPIAWDSKDMELNSGNIDCIWNGFTIDGREDAYTWSEPYVDNKIVFVTGAASKITSATDLKGKSVLVQADSSGLRALKSDANKDLVASFKQLTEVPDYNNGLMELESGAADAMAVDQSVGQYQINLRGKDKFNVFDPGFPGEKYGIGFKKGNTALRDQVQKTLDEMKKDGTLEKIAEKWGQQDVVIR